MFRKTLTASAAAALVLAACKGSPPSTSIAPLAGVEVRKPIASLGLRSVTPTPIPKVSEPPADPLALAPEGSASADPWARAVQLKSEGDLAGALAEARRALWKNPEDEEALRFIGKIGPAVKEQKLAAQAFERLSKIHAEDATPLIQQARILLGMGEADEALIVAALAETRDAQDPEVFQIRGRAQLERGDLSAAIAAFEQVLERAPDHGYAMNNMGLAFLRSNQNEKAAEVLERAAIALPNIAYVHNNLGVALERLGRVEEARAAYDQATMLSPKYVKALVNSARVSKVAAVTPASEPLPEMSVTE